MKGPYKGDVFHCMHPMVQDGQTAIYKTHLIFEGLTPFLVLEWEDVEGGMAPLVVAKIDHSRLSAPNPGATDRNYVYGGIVRFPEDIV
jgi:hypothetical protein